MLTIIAPMEEELAPVRAALAPFQGRQDAAGHPLLSFSVVGIGRERVEPGLKGLLHTLRQQRANAEAPPGLLLLGFAGGVDPSLSPGDLALAGRYCHLRSLGETLVHIPAGLSLEEMRQRMMAETEARDPGLPQRAVLKFENFRQRVMARWEAKDPNLPARSELKFLEPDPGMWQDAQAALLREGLTAVETDSMTTYGVVTATDTRRELHRQYQVDTVNMEDYWVARLAAAAKVPFLSVRAVVDTADQRLPAYLPELPGRTGWAALQNVVRPWQLPALLRLSRGMPRAQASLARFAQAFVSYRYEMTRRPPDAV